MNLWNGDFTSAATLYIHNDIHIGLKEQIPEIVVYRPASKYSILNYVIKYVNLLRYNFSSQIQHFASILN